MNSLQTRRDNARRKAGQFGFPPHGVGLCAVEMGREFRRLRLIKPASVSGSGKTFNDRINS
jgi:hypothetical protein